MKKRVCSLQGRIKYYDVVNEAICDCVGWPGSPHANCEEYMANEEGAEEMCGYSERYATVNKGKHDGKEHQMCLYRAGLKKSGPQVA